MSGTAKRAFLAALMAGIAAPALAADLIEAPAVVPVVQDPFGGWYLRGHIGMSNQRLGELFSTDMVTLPDNHDFLNPGEFDSAPTFSLGVGYQFNPWLRGDITGEYRGKASFSALDRYSDPTVDGDPTTWDATNDYSAQKSEWLVLANAYADLGEWRGIVPYVGAGIGASRNTIHNFTDVNEVTAGVSYGDSDPQWNFAWALHAGLGYRATENLTIDFGYSYLDLGDARTKPLVPYDNSTTFAPMQFRDITSHDLKLGIRYALH